MSRSRLALAFSVTVSSLVAGCGGSLLEDARHQFDRGEYAEAKSTLLQIDASEYRSQDWRKQTAYALVRGLVMGALGDRTEAQAWLGLAKESEEQHPGSLSREDVARLKLAEEQYGPLPPTATARPPG
jgi:hypothetical protein